MPKGFITQTACILLSRSVPLDELVPLLGHFQILGRTEGTDEGHIGGPTLVISYRANVNGKATLDCVDRVWPDGMGDPKTDSSLFCAWSMGHYGPFTFPNGLARAVDQAWSWPSAGEAKDQHRAVIRIRTTYVHGGGMDAKILPKDYDALDELQFITRLALAVCAHPAALAYFNPNGEVLLAPDAVKKSVEYHGEHQLPPLNVWANVRLFNTNDWQLMDTVGMGQLDIMDFEACFPKGAYDPADIANLLRNVSLYLLKKGPVIKHGDTMNGPGGVSWRAFHCGEPLSSPPRSTLRWFPLDGSNPPASMLPSEPSEEDKPAASFGAKLRSWFKNS